MARCCECGKDSPMNRACQYCGEIYCETHWPLHMSREKRHEGLAEEMSRLWRREHALASEILTVNS